MKILIYCHTNSCLIGVFLHFYYNFKFLLQKNKFSIPIPFLKLSQK